MSEQKLSKPIGPKSSKTNSSLMKRDKPHKNDWLAKREPTATESNLNISLTSDFESTLNVINLPRLYSKPSATTRPKMIRSSTIDAITQMNWRMSKTNSGTR